MNAPSIGCRVFFWFLNWLCEMRAQGFLRLLRTPEPGLFKVMRVLWVEDSLRLQRSIGKALRKSGDAVDLSGDDENGLWLAESNDYDAIILDIMLPKMDGLTLLLKPFTHFPTAP